MKKIQLALITLLSIFSITVFASDFDYTIAGEFGNKDPAFHLQNDLPADFLDKEQTNEKEFEITQLSAKENGKYKVEFYNSTEHAPKRKVVIMLYKLNPKTKKFEVLNTNFYFFENTNFWFVGRNSLSPNDFLSIGISHKNYFDKK